MNKAASIIPDRPARHAPIRAPDYGPGRKQDEKSQLKKNCDIFKVGTDSERPESNFFASLASMQAAMEPQSCINFKSKIKS